MRIGDTLERVRRVFHSSAVGCSYFKV
ncbi:hypothetical protein PanWU01x14_093340 [Parasponia andersonii]|uniref:Uncharacterized protein n=1 Tax=Parasponia andersonii TaxID=3476 RepID=A0A2P5D617_PARAD|nr:hypothetical protein PanWU01x14_093340 [Parasponia andersonii]